MPIICLTAGFLHSLFNMSRVHDKIKMGWTMGNVVAVHMQNSHHNSNNSNSSHTLQHPAIFSRNWSSMVEAGLFLHVDNLCSSPHHWLVFWFNTIMHPYIYLITMRETISCITQVCLVQKYSHIPQKQTSHNLNIALILVTDRKIKLWTGKNRTLLRQPPTFLHITKYKHTP